ncbi:MAG: MotA/TolQ/ExbB proton channel family protein [Chlamydiia bacterium]|nr:MotA/TolQ/ExbB proton channel family protein [Chlamydiia bacterium]
MGTFFQAYAQADFFGKLIFFALFLLSCGAWVFLIQKFLLIKKLRLSSLRFKKLATLHREELLNLNAKSTNPFSNLFTSIKTRTLALLDKNHFFADQNQNFLSKADIDFLESHLHTMIAKEKGTIEKNLFILSTTVALAPFLGLLGTVWGILIAFGELQAGHSVTSSVVILGGLSTALTTTVLGLLIAIPALIANNYFKNLSKQFTLEMIDFSDFLLSTIELQYRRVDVPS